LLEDKRLVKIKDFGAGSKTNASRQRKVQDIARIRLNRQNMPASVQAG
jgi:hypothetical protein